MLFMYLFLLIKFRPDSLAIPGLILLLAPEFFWSVAKVAAQNQGAARRLLPANAAFQQVS
jgi:hypothetical protein